MVLQASNPVREFEHRHEKLSKLALEVGRLLRSIPGSGEDARRLRTCLESLRDELVAHFAQEEEGLFPFVRANLPATAVQVDRLTLAHDAICGAVVRLAHAARASRPGEGGAVLVSLYERFESAYGQHSREEAALFAELNTSLAPSQRAELVALLAGL